MTAKRYRITNEDKTLLTALMDGPVPLNEARLARVPIFSGCCSSVEHLIDPKRLIEQGLAEAPDEPFLDVFVKGTELHGRRLIEEKLLREDAELEVWSVPEGEGVASPRVWKATLNDEGGLRFYCPEFAKKCTSPSAAPMPELSQFVDAETGEPWRPGRPLRLEGALFDYARKVVAETTGRSPSIDAEEILAMLDEAAASGNPSVAMTPRRLRLFAAMLPRVKESEEVTAEGGFTDRLLAERLAELREELEKDPR